jgi:hypothetical protein
MDNLTIRKRAARFMRLVKLCVSAMSAQAQTDYNPEPNLLPIAGHHMHL